MKKEVITVQEGGKLVNELKKAVAIAEGKFSMIYIESTLIDEKSLIKSLFGNDFIIEDTGYEISVCRHNESWWLISHLYLRGSTNVYTVANNVEDRVAEKCEEVDIYIKKSGSETKIDEE